MVLYRVSMRISQINVVFVQQKNHAMLPSFCAGEALTIINPSLVSFGKLPAAKIPKKFSNETIFPTNSVFHHYPTVE